MGYAAVGAICDVDESKHHGGVLSRDGEVAGHGNAHANAGRSAFDPGDGRLRDIAQTHDEFAAGTDAFAGRVDALVKTLLHGLDVAAGREAAAGAADNHAADAGVALADVQALVQVSHNLNSYRVLVRGVVEGQVGNAAFTLKKDLVELLNQLSHLYIFLPLKFLCLV